MFLEALGSAVLGLALAWVAAVRLPHRLPPRALVLPTGIAGALFGAFLTATALGSGNALVILVGALVFAAASVSLLLRPTKRLHSSSAPA
ncbi:hypothetical protein SGFS_044480 [Streptomyces graminofaciens]|uniref:Integral membrane protein n=1 Tax=Streptomyces graminofaciens TaxID=68212 RepID=A0ABN5VIE0_9ACTN|nr:hypothetical protein [Streptomyces graminofaciens]BBC33154.1 hypothetical protein SGFS_044480 [Streptomyces graminofaciens]